MDHPIYCFLDIKVIIMFLAKLNRLSVVYMTKTAIISGYKKAVLPVEAIYSGSFTV